LICENDLEGIVAKLKMSRYTPGRTHVNVISCPVVMTKAMFGIVLLCAASAHAQASRTASTAQMNICSVPLTIGMTKGAFTDKISQFCDMRKVPAGADSWALKEKGQDGKAVGIVEFSAGRISEVRRTWAPKGGRYQPEDLARSLVSAVESALQGRNAVTGIVSYTVKREPDMTLYQVTLSLPNHREVRVALIEDPAKPIGRSVIMLDVEEFIVR
jgi:hypothetical protein